MILKRLHLSPQTRFATTTEIPTGATPETPDGEEKHKNIQSQIKANILPDD
jgi:hypothetical protein